MVLSQSTKRAIAYGSTSFASAAMHNIFITYYIHFFLETYTLDDSWFYVGEVVFMVWNSFNDPWFGWLLDSSPSKNRLLSRIPIIRYGGLFWCISFTLIFFPLLSSSSTYLGLHFIITLCLYDGMLSLVLLCHGSLLADITSDTKERAKCNMYSSIFCVLGSSSVLISQLFWDKHSILPFQLFVFSLSIICFISFNITASSLSSHLSSSSSSSKHSKAKGEEEWGNSSNSNNSNSNSNSNSSNVNKMINEKPSLPPNFMHFVKEIFQLRNFVLFILINLIQVFNCHFNSNFMSITMEKLLLLDASSKQLASLLITIPSLAPHLIVIICTPIVKQRGLHFLLNVLFFIKFFFSLSLLVFGSSEAWYLILFFILLNKSFSEAICRHGNLVLADIVDEDRVVYGRNSSYSSLIFGVNALFTKPGQSLAPILGWTVLRTFVGEGEVEYIFFMLCMVPFICSILQLYLWNIFTLKGYYLRDIKRQLENLEHYV